MPATRPTATASPPLPSGRGPLSDHLLAGLRQPGRELAPGPAPGPGAGPEALADDDLQLALYTCYELHYRGFQDVDPAWEWEPSLLRYRRGLEAAFEAALAAAVPRPPLGPVPARLAELIATAGGPSLSAVLEASGRTEHLVEFAVHRSAYQLKEADPHTWAIPRLPAGRTKSALVEIQADEYGGGAPGQTHAELFAATMAALGLDPTYGAYLDHLPGVTLATVNLVSLFGLHRRWRGALIGHLAVFEMTSAGPMARYSRALARLGAPAAARRFYDVHVEADAHHAVVAAGALAGALAADQPELAADILFGAAALMEVEARLTRHLLACWSEGRTSLRAPLPGTTAPVLAPGPAPGLSLAS